MTIIKKSLTLFLAFTLSNLTIAQNDTIKAKILDDGSQDAEKFYNSGISDFADKNYAGALSNFNHAIEKKPDFEKAYYNRGITEFETKSYKAAIADYDKSLSYIQSADSYFSRGQAKYALGDKPGALADYSKTIEIKYLFFDDD